MIDYKEIIAENISNAIEIEKLEGVLEEDIYKYIEIPPNDEMGDYAFPCFKLAKVLKKSPLAIANDIKEKLDFDENIEKIEAIGGYLNFYINKLILTKQVLNDIASKGEKYGASTLGNGKNIIVEYSSPNIAKPFHIGHLRNTVIGNALYKIYNFLGYNVTGINHLGDYRNTIW